MFYLSIFNIVKNMKYVLVGPGCSSIPPKGWGAVESIVWDYYEELTKQGHQAIIVNCSTTDEIIKECNIYPDSIVHIMYDDHITIVPYLLSKKILYTSHLALLTDPSFETVANPYYENIFKKVLEYQSMITFHALSKEIEDVYKRYGYSGKSIVMRNGARPFRTTKTPKKANRSIYVGKIEFRKCQHKYKSISCIDFVGNYHNSPLASSHYLGEWDKPTLYHSLTEYGNLILLSEAEADPLVVKEALMAGLGVVISECASANLDLSKEFITVIPKDKLDDLVYVSKKIEQNRAYSLQHREDILTYAIYFSWKTIIKEYTSSIEQHKESTVSRHNSMKIVLVGPGILSIPPPGWGAVEILIWEYSLELKQQGHEVVIVNPIRKNPTDQLPNTPYSKALIQEINGHQADVIHIHYDCLHYIIPFIKCPRVCISSHYPYIGNTKEYGGYHSIFHSLCQNHRHFIFAISKKDYEVFKTYAVYPEKVYYTPNGTTYVEPLDRPGLYLDKSIYVAKVEPRKKQHVYCCLPNIDFYGKCDDTAFRSLSCYKGEKEHGELMKLIREYGSLVLLSDGESDPLVLKEALIAGLPVVTNCHSGMPELPFLDIIPDDKLQDMKYIDGVLEKSRQKDRTGIKEYASQFEWKNVVERYISILNLKL